MPGDGAGASGGPGWHIARPSQLPWGRAQSTKSYLTSKRLCPPSGLRLCPPSDPHLCREARTFEPNAPRITLGFPPRSAALSCDHDHCTTSPRVLTIPKHLRPEIFLPASYPLVTPVIVARSPHAASI